MVIVKHLIISQNGGTELSHRSNLMVSLTISGNWTRFCYKINRALFGIVLVHTIT